MLKPHNLLIHARDLTRGYPHSPSLIFQKFNLALYKHEFSVITGRSGKGKSTLTKLLLRKHPFPNKMLFHKNEDIARFSTKEIQDYRQKIGMIFQDYKLLERKTVLENIVYPLQITGTPLSHIKRKADKMLKLLNLEKEKDTITRFLSGGEKQKVAIARALIHDPEFIVADEPTGNLDREDSKAIADTFIELNKIGHTILLITHDLFLKQYLEKNHDIEHHHIE